MPASTPARVGKAYRVRRRTCEWAAGVGDKTAGLILWAVGGTLEGLRTSHAMTFVRENGTQTGC